MPHEDNVPNKFSQGGGFSLRPPGFGPPRGDSAGDINFGPPGVGNAIGGAVSGFANGLFSGANA